MADSRRDDLDWLYRRSPDPQPEPERTRVLSADEQQALARRTDRRGTPSPEPGRDSSGPAQPQQRQPSGSWQSQQPRPPAQPPRNDPARNGPAGHGPAGGGPGDEPSASPPAPRTPRRRRPARTIVRTIVVLVALFLVYLVAVPVYAWTSVTRVNTDPGGQRPAAQPGHTYLLVGSDSRKGLTSQERKKLGTGQAAGQRTDTIMVLYDPPAGKPVLVSIPRDSYLPIPGNGTNKINAAFAFGGAPLLVHTVEQNTGLRIDGYMEVGFGGFVNVIDALGGIKMCLPRAIKDKDAHINLPKGCQNLSGVNALGYVRERKADPRGDLGRVERQRQMLAAIAKKAASPASVLNPFRYWGLNHAVATSVSVGKDTGLVALGRMGLTMKGVAGGSGLTLTVPIADPNASTPAGSAVLWDNQRAKELFAEIANGDTSNLKRFAKP